MCQAGLRTPKRTYTDEAGEEITVKPSGCTNHSIRRTAAQWAGRCLARDMDVLNNGRWKDYNTMSKYVAQGKCERELAIDGGAEDPIWSVWVWKPCTVPSFDGRSQF